MTARTCKKTVTFSRPFFLSGIGEVQPAGLYGRGDGPYYRTRAGPRWSRALLSRTRVAAMMRRDLSAIGSVVARRKYEVPK